MQGMSLEAKIYPKLRRFCKKHNLAFSIVGADYRQGRRKRIRRIWIHNSEACTLFNPLNGDIDDKLSYALQRLEQKQTSRKGENDE